MLTACGGVEGTSTDWDSQTTTTAGRLSVRMMAEGSSRGPVDDGALDAIIVNIAEVRTHGSQGWVTISTAPQRVDILRLGEHAAELGIAELPDGAFGQLRLVVAEGSSSYVVTPDGVQHALKTPSGEQSGLKIKGGFEVRECADTEVVLALDRGKSIHVHRTGHDDQWSLRPVIRATSRIVDREDCGEEVPGPLDPNQPFEPNDPTDPELPTDPGTTDPSDPPNDGETPPDPIDV